MRRILTLLICLATVASNAACATLPLNSNNQLGPEFSTGEASESIYYSPVGPSEGDTQGHILSGFFYAGNGPQEDYAVAREYLTKNFATKWQPSKETLIQSAAPETIQDSGTKIKIRIRYDARITEDGLYVSEPNSVREIELKMLQQDGEWRIASAPNLTVLLRPNFDVLFDPISIYFWDASLSYLVPDVRWFPSKASLPTKLVNTILAGPNSWIKPAIANIFPKGTRLNINSVTVNAGVANVDLNSVALKIPAWKLPYVKSQLKSTLIAVQGVKDVKISIERTEQSIISSVNGIPAKGSDTPLVLNDSGISYLTGKVLVPLSTTTKLVNEQLANAFVISSDENILALRGEAVVMGYRVGLIKSEKLLIDSRPNLVRPTIDPFNSIWTATTTAGDFIRVKNMDGTEVVLPNPLKSGIKIQEITVSSDGARIAVLHSASHGESVSVFPVIRDKNRVVVSLGEALEIGSFSNVYKSISWLNQTTLIGIAQDATGIQSVKLFEIGGVETQLRQVSRAVSVVSTQNGFYYLNADGQIFASKNASWELVGENFTALQMAGR